MENFHILVDPDKFFLNEDWATIEEVLKPEGEDPNQLTAIMGDKISEFMVFMAVSERMPERIKRKSLAQLAVLISSSLQELLESNLQRYKRNRPAKHSKD